MTKIKIWSIKVNNFGWDEPSTLYFDTKRKAEQAREKFDGADAPRYCGMFKPANAINKLSWTKQFMEGR